MSTAIRLGNSRNVLFRNVFISGFNKGIEAVNSNMLLDGVNVQRCGIGIDLRNSDAVFHRSNLTNNAIDVVVNKSRAYMINTIAQRVLELLPKGDYRINPYQIQNLAINVINTRDIQEKRRRFRKLLNYLTKYSHIWTIYSIIKEIFRFAGILI